MGAAVKLLIGLIVLAIGLLLFADELFLHVLPIKVMWWQNFLTLVTGFVPIFLVLIGLFVLWLEIDELKTAKEFKKEGK